ncbi:MAG: DUF370 domain-containing protein [Clostridiales bacterium]|jgi:ribosomal protein S8|nr:DUF370 domain-containing protein [Clostridiales bacterium]
MVLHLGEDTVVSMKNVIAVLDAKTACLSRINREFLKTAEEEGFIKKVSNEEPKTIVLAEVNKKSVIYLSPISSTTLLKRSTFIEKIALDRKNTEGNK